jgi:hypothetical protein
MQRRLEVSGGETGSGRLRTMRTMYRHNVVLCHRCLGRKKRMYFACNLKKSALLRCICALSCTELNGLIAYKAQSKFVKSGDIDRLRP